MPLMENWFRRRTTIVSVLFIIAVLAASVLRSAQLGPSRVSGPSVYSVSIQYFGVDAQEMEQLITVPLEDAISNIAGIRRLRSISEYGKSTVEITLAASTVSNHFYLELRDAVNTVYSTLPQAVQRPQIISASNAQRPFFIATVSVAGATLDQDRSYADKVVKPTLEQIGGVGDVEVAGGSQREVHVVVNQKQAAADGLSLSAIAGILQSQYLTEPVGLLRTDATDVPIILHGRFSSLDALSALPLSLNGSRIVRLGQVAKVEFGGRELDTISRINGARRVSLYVKSSGSANIVSVSKALRARLRTLESSRVSFDVVYDLGSDIGGSILDVLSTLAIAEVIVALFVAFVLRPFGNALLIAGLLPSVVLVSAAILTAAGLSIDENILSGMIVGMGLIVDPAIVMVSALLAAPPDSVHGSTARIVGQLAPPLIASATTTLIVLVPLLSMGQTIPALSEVSYSIGSMLMVALCAAILFVPAFAYRPREAPGRLPAPASPRRIFRRSQRTIDRVVRLAARHPVAVLAAALTVCGAGGIAAARMDLVLSSPTDPRSVYAHVEYESGTSIAAIDRRTKTLATQIGRLRGVKHVETISRRGSSDITVTLTGTPADASRVRTALTTLGREIKGGFVYLPEGSTGSEQTIQVSLIGPQNSLLRATAGSTAQALHQKEWVNQVVLNFKPGPPTYLFRIDHELLSQYGVSTASVADALRWGMYGPVALKWFDSDSRQIDLRVRDSQSERENLMEIENTTVLNSKGQAIPLMQLGSFKLVHPPSRIYRTDRQRAVYFTVGSTLRNTGLFLDRLRTFLRSVRLPSGYAFRIDRSVYDRIRQFQRLALLLAAALLLIYIALATQTESLTTPLVIMSTVPISLSAPIVFLWASGSGIDVPVIVALIIMSGMAVNNAILILDRTLTRCGRLSSFTAGEVTRSLRYSIRRRARALFLTSITTILGLLPFLFSSTSSSQLFRPLAVVVLFGTVGSIIASFSVLPAVASIAPVFLRRIPRFGRQEA